MRTNNTMAKKMIVNWDEYKNTVEKLAIQIHKEYNPTVLISTHRTNHLMRVDKIGVLIDGKLVQYGNREDILKQNQQG